jgi:hypothetical protein
LIAHGFPAIVQLSGRVVALGVLQSSGFNHCENVGSARPDLAPKKLRSFREEVDHCTRRLTGDAVPPGLEEAPLLGRWLPVEQVRSHTAACGDRDVTHCQTEVCRGHAEVHEKATVLRNGAVWSARSAASI